MIDLQKEINSILKDYGDSVAEVLKTAVPKVAKGAAKKLRSDSPKRTGEYARGWTSKAEQSRLGASAVVYGSKGTGSLAHLLENGHAKRNGGRVAGIVHIAPVEEWARDELVKEIEDSIK